MMVTRTRANKAGTTLSIQPADALIDVPRGIRVEHVAPETVEITALTRRNGVLCPRRLRRGRGRQRGPDARRARLGRLRRRLAHGPDLVAVPGGLAQPRALQPSVAEPLVTEIVARRRGPGPFTQRLAAEGVTRQDVREHGLVGTLYLPPGARLASRRADPERFRRRHQRTARRAVRLAATPPSRWPISRRRACRTTSPTPRWVLPDRPALAAPESAAKHDFVAVSGQSRGGELVLLLGATFPTEVSAVVARARRRGP